MSDVSIKNGGTGDIARVDKNQLLGTTAVETPERDRACLSDIGQKYNINTGDITLTNATKTSVLYIKNTGTDDLVLTSFIYILGNTTGGSGDAKVDVIRNPETGDIISNANNVLVGSTVAANLNYGSSNTISADIYKGATGESAFSDGDINISTLLSNAVGRSVISLGYLILPKGSAVGLDYTPPTGNTSQTVQFAAAAYVRTTKVAAV